ncbi:3-phosphoserine/phosphohydroxythreonine transaminase [Alkalicoccus chagannorensis]|uniref:3-phosphoserine/phosphohydroxythreonine transaminase n=1 Tax=Alkalicoccus chagannorensis TaxID=427072 RepID=UPI00041CF2E5|nr:3-phosphoserine/phosphohydroxythreonine transaminase [Alkalicoccus chagannorensis]
MTTVYNFNAGPGPIPDPVLKQAQTEMFSFEQTGAAVMELSHRSAPYEKIHFQAMKQIRTILDVPDDFDILFLQGGATLQFSMTAQNFLRPEQRAAFVLSGSWSEKAEKEASAFGSTTILASTKESQYRSVPEIDLSSAPEDTAYVHLTSNNTIFGTQLQQFPKKAAAPVIVDMSSDILSRRVPWSDVDFAYAGAQKNAGMAGVTIVIARKSLLASGSDALPPSISYKQHADKDSLYHTPPTGAVYMTKLVTDWILAEGGIDAIAEAASKKAEALYAAIDQSDGFYRGHADAGSRSSMNVTFRLPDEDLEKQFLQEAADAGFLGLNGHRSVGGCRASLYNAVPFHHVEVLIDFMEKFRHRHS